MQGFSNRFTDFPGYVLGITKEIWEDRGVGARLKDYYAPDVIVRSSRGVEVGEPATTRATLSTLAEMPDRQLLGEDVIWCGTEEQGMLSSHRLLSVATHAGGAFGPPSGVRLSYRVIADCWARDGQIHDEWLLRDNGAIIRQLGSEPRDWAQREVDAGRGHVFTPAADVLGPYTGRGDPGEWGALYQGLLERLMAAEFSVIPVHWDRACELAHPGGGSGHGWAAADQFWLGLRASFPSAEFRVHHVIGREDPSMPPRAAIRWSLDGLHDGWGVFGAPTGRPVHVMGISHAEFGPYGREAGGSRGTVRREYVLYDEAAIWMQILGGAA